MGFSFLNINSRELFERGRVTALRRMPPALAKARG
jgi:hypothetical protein